MKKSIAILLFLAAAGCKQKNNTGLVLTSVVTGTFTAATATAPSSCTFDPGGTETSYLPFNPAQNTGTVGVVVLNQIQPTTSVSSLLTDASTFLPHQAVVDYEIVGQGAVGGEKIVPVSGSVAGGSSTSVIVALVPSGAVGTPAAGSVIRTTFHLEGKLADGSTVHTSEREYLFVVCTTAGCAGNPCL